MNNFFWTTLNNDYIYVDSNFGSDNALFGDGTMQKPFLSLSKAVTKSKTIVCRGYFSENLPMGNHNLTIMADFNGAATFDGQNKYSLFGYGHLDMIIRNVAFPLNSATHSPYWGVGRADHVSGAGYADAASGVYGVGNTLDNCMLWYGAIPGIGSKNVYANIKAYENELKAWFFGYNDQNVANNTLYNIKKGDRRLKPTDYKGTISDTLFSKVALFMNDSYNFSGCFFAADCDIYLTFNDTDPLQVEGTTSEERLQFIKDAATERGLTISSNFTNCVFSTEIDTDIFNNPKESDFTLKMTSGAAREGHNYIGAMPPALNVPILEDSTGVVGSWDENTIKGNFTIEDGNIVLGEGEESGEILSKVITIDSSKYSVDQLWSVYGTNNNGISNFGNGYYDANGDKPYIEFVKALDPDNYEEILPGSYMVSKGKVTLEVTTIVDEVPSVQEYEYNVQSVFRVDQNSTRIKGNADLYELKDPNLWNHCFIRWQRAIYRYLTSSEELQKGGVYLNTSSSNVIYNGRTIVPNESFIAENDGDTFEGEEVGILFDDDRVPKANWYPIKLIGYVDVFEGEDENGVKYASGNYNSYKAFLSRPRYLNYRYYQFKLKANTIYVPEVD